MTEPNRLRSSGYDSQRPNVIGTPCTRTPVGRHESAQDKKRYHDRRDVPTSERGIIPYRRDSDDTSDDVQIQAAIAMSELQQQMDNQRREFEAHIADMRETLIQLAGENERLKDLVARHEQVEQQRIDEIDRLGRQNDELHSAIEAVRNPTDAVRVVEALTGHSIGDLTRYFEESSDVVALMKFGSKFAMMYNAIVGCTARGTFDNAVCSVALQEHDIVQIVQRTTRDKEQIGLLLDHKAAEENLRVQRRLFEVQQERAVLTRQSAELRRSTSEQRVQELARFVPVEPLQQSRQQNRQASSRGADAHSHLHQHEQEHPVSFSGHGQTLGNTTQSVRSRSTGEGTRTYIDNGAVHTQYPRTD